MNNFRDKIRGLTGLHTALEGLLTTINQIPVSSGGGGGSATDSNFIDWVGRVAISTLTTTAKTVGGAINELATDYIVEQGTDGIWHYEKWASGKAKCWGNTSVNVGTSISGDSFITINQAYPSNLFLTIKSGSCDCDVHESSTDYSLNFNCTPRFNTNGVGGYLWNCTGSSKTVGTYKINMIVKGTWK